MKEKTYWKSLCYRRGTIVSDYDNSKWVVGQWRVNPYPVTKTCEGLNCSEMIVDAMGYVNCEVLAQVEIRGAAIVSDDKVTAQEMRIVKAWKWENEDSVAMAIYAAERVIEYYEKEYPNDTRPRQAIDAAKSWLVNPTRAAYAAAYASYAAAADAAAYASYAAYAAAYASDAAYAAAYASYAAHAADAASDASYAAAYAAHAAHAADAYAAHAAAAHAADAASDAASATARFGMKKKIQKWIISRIENKEVFV